MDPDQCLQLRNHGNVIATPEVGFQAVLEPEQAELLEPGGLVTDIRQAPELGQALSPPQTESLMENRTGGVRVSRASRPRRPRATTGTGLRPGPPLRGATDSPRPTFPAPRDRWPSGASRRSPGESCRLSRRRTVPELGDQGLGRHALIAMKRQQRQQRALFRRPDCQPLTLHANGQGAENPDPHRVHPLPQCRSITSAPILHRSCTDHGWAGRQARSRIATSPRTWTGRQRA